MLLVISWLALCGLGAFDLTGALPTTKMIQLRLLGIDGCIAVEGNPRDLYESANVS